MPPHILAILLIALLLAVAFIGFQFCMYLISYYAVNTRRRFLEVMLNPFYRSSYRLGQKVERIIKKQTGWVLFDLNIPPSGADPAKDPAKAQVPNLTIDSLALAEFGVIAMFYQESTGKIVSQTDEDNWVVFETTKEDSPSTMIPSPVPAIENITALLLELFASESLHIKQVIPLLVFGNSCDIADIQLPDGMCKLHYRQLTKEIHRIQQEQDILYDKPEWLAATRALVPYANSVIAKPENTRRGSKDVIALTHDFMNRKSPASANSEFMRKAGRFAAAKEEFDALTWRRITEISQELGGGCSKERTATLAAELQQIAQTNIALSYNFSAAETPFTATPTPEEAELHTQALNAPSMGTRETMQTALDTSSFFNQESAEKTERNTEHKRH